MILESLLRTPTTYLYDGENRMTKMTNPDGTVMTSTYQGEGLRRTRQFFGEPRPTTFVWDGSDYLGEIH